MRRSNVKFGASTTNARSPNVAVDSVAIVSRRLRVDVTMLMTPPIAPVPYSVAPPPSTTSMRSTPAVGKAPRSSAPSWAPAKGRPSSSTSVWFEPVPRMVTLADEPTGPVRVSATPGMFSSAAATVVNPRRTMSAFVTTYVVLLVAAVAGADAPDLFERGGGCGGLRLRCGLRERGSGTECHENGAERRGRADRHKSPSLDARGEGKHPRAGILTLRIGTDCCGLPVLANRDRSGSPLTVARPCRILTGFPRTRNRECLSGDRRPRPWFRRNEGRTPGSRRRCNRQGFSRTDSRLGVADGMLGVANDNMSARADLPAVPALADARSKWTRGDFGGCLALLDTIGTLRAGNEPWVEATLLRARSLYRLRRYPQNIALLEPILSAFADGDESCTARMLLGSSIARSGDVDRGLAILDATAEHAEARGVHRAIRAEIAHACALAHWTRREHAETERLARLAEAAGADIISVRATQLRGFVALTLQRFAEALVLFNLTLDAYWRCRQRDADLAEMTVHQIAMLELMLRSRDVPGTHAVPDRRRVRDPWDATPDAASVTRLQTFVFDAWLFAHDGDRDTAFRKVRRAEEMATAPAWRVWALAGRASLAAAFGELGSAREHAALATELSAGVEWAATTGEERVGLLFLAETLAATDPAGAVTTLKTYDALSDPMDPDHAFSTDPRFRATEDFVRGLVLRATGREAAATKLLKSAANRYAACGHLWRAVAARIALASTSPRGADLDELRETVAEHFPNSFLARRVGIDALSDPIVGSLTPAQRDVLALLLAGYNAREIATHTGRAYNTVRVHIDRLREAFKTSSIHALVVDCHRRGVVLPVRAAPLRDEAVRNCG